MKTLSLILTCCLFLSIWLCPPAHAETYIVSGNPKAPPVMWEQYNKLTGVGPDLAKAILTDLGLDFDIRVEGNWEEVQKKCKSGKVDMIVAAYKNDARAEYMDYSIPYLPQPTVIVTKKEYAFPFGRWESLIGKKGVSNIGESYGQEFDSFIREKLDVQFVAFERALELLRFGKADYLIIDLYTALIYARLLQGEDAISILDPPVTTQTFHITVSKKSSLSTHMKGINEKLAALIKDGTMEDLFYKHFEEWKQLIAKRSRFFKKDSAIRGREHTEYLKAQDEYEKEKLGSLLLDAREGLPLSAD